MSHFKPLQWRARIPPQLYNFKTEAFVNGIRDPEIKLAVCSAQKTISAEIMGFALAQETACTISTLQVSKVIRINVVVQK